MTEGCSDKEDGEKDTGIKRDRCFQYRALPLVHTRVVHGAVILKNKNRVDAVRGAEILAMQTVTVLRVYENNSEVGIVFGGGIN